MFQEPAVVRAFEVACHAYGSRRQQDGQPLLTHAVATARILGEMGLDADVVAAGLLQVSLMVDTGASAGCQCRGIRSCGIARHLTQAAAAQFETSWQQRFCS